MGHRGDGANLPYCGEDGCGRRAYLVDLCYVCDAALFNEWLPKLLCGSPARQSSTPLQEDFMGNPLQDFMGKPALAGLCMEFLYGDGAALFNERLPKLLRGTPVRQSSAPLQDFMGNPALAGLCMGFLYGDGWGQQCHCTRCKRPWLNAGWVCPVEYQRRTYLQHLDRMFRLAGYTAPDLCYVDWGAAVRQLHDMETDEIPLDPRVLVEFARASCRRVREELNEMYPGERFLDEPYPDDDIFDDVGEMHPDELDAVPPGAPRSRDAQF